MLTLYLLTNHGHVLFVLFIRLTQSHHFRSVYIYMLCSHLEVWGDGGGSEMKWLPSSRPLLESNLPLDISNEPVGLFTAMSVVTGPGFICCFFGGAFHGFIWQDILETDDRKWDKREGMTCSLDSLPTEVQVNPKPRYSSAKWGLSLTLTKCFLCLTRSEPQKNTNYYTEMFSKYEPYKCLFVVCRKVQHQQLLWRSVTYKHANIC